MTQAVAHQPPNDPTHEEHRLSKGKVGMSCLIITESFFFMAFIVAEQY